MELPATAALDGAEDTAGADAAATGDEDGTAGAGVADEEAGSAGC